MKTAASTVLLLLLCFAAISTNSARTQTEEQKMKRLFLEIEDGDTVVYRGQRMRFLGVDTPEIRNPDLGFWIDQPYGREAKEFTRRHIRGARLITYVSDGVDRYDRLLVHLFVDGYPLSLMIVEAGLGYETVTVFGDGGYPEIASMILDASRLNTHLPFENQLLTVPPRIHTRR